MSAYIVDKNHIIYLVEAAMHNGGGHPARGPLYWYFGNPTEHDQLGQGDYDKAAEIANKLWQENILSVSHRYPGESSDTLPGPIGGSFVIEPSDFRLGREINPVQVLMSCACFEYQSCEHPGWKTSEARAFIESLRAAAIHALPGYDDCIWGAPEPGHVITHQGTPARFHLARAAVLTLEGSKTTR